MLKEDTAKLYIVGKRKTNGIRDKWHKNTLVVKVKNGCGSGYSFVQMLEKINKIILYVLKIMQR